VKGKQPTGPGTKTEPPPTNGSGSDHESPPTDAPKPKQAPTTQAPVPTKPSQAVKTAPRETPPTGTNRKPSAYDTIINPVLTTLAQDAKTPEQKQALEELKLSFENAEQHTPGITHKLLAQIIQMLQKR